MANSLAANPLVANPLQSFFLGLDQTCHGGREESDRRAVESSADSIFGSPETPSMTQLLLFDGPAPTDTVVLPGKDAALASASFSAAEPRESSADGGENLAERLQSDGGLNHMGDLARLVLLRYDLMAKRRAQFAARRRAR